MLYNLLKKLFMFLLPIVRQAAVQTAADELNKRAYPRATVRRYNKPVDFDRRSVPAPLIDNSSFRRGMDSTIPQQRQATDEFGKYIEKDIQDTLDLFRDNTGTGEVLEFKQHYHDVVMIAFDIDGPSAEHVHKWLQSQLPAGDASYGENEEIHLDAWWVANDERYDGSDCDSAVFVTMGKQKEARQVLRRHGLLL